MAKTKSSKQVKLEQDAVANATVADAVPAAAPSTLGTPEDSAAADVNAAVDVDAAAGAVAASSKPQSIVIKIGSTTLTGSGKALNRVSMLEIVRVIAQLKAAGHKVTLVTSGAVAAGREVIKDHHLLPQQMSSKQLLASVGQGRLIEIWESLFAIYNIQIGQILLTRADLENRERFVNARDTLFALLEHNIVPVINENDAVSTAEIKVGDNDTLSAITACAIEADKLILLTDQKGLFDANPDDNPEAKLIREVTEIDERIKALAGGSGSDLGTGGMATKVKAALFAMNGGVEMIIAAGSNPGQIPDLIEGKGEGTFFRPKKSAQEQRKVWLATATMPQGKLYLDAGAAAAIKERGSSLLPSGITTVVGEFPRGSVVGLYGPDDKRIGKGIVRYNNTECGLIMGKRSSDIESILGFSHGVVVHRNDLVLF